MLSTEFRQRCRNVIERLAKEMIDQASVQLTAYFEVELARQLNSIDASAHKSDSEGGDRHETPIDLSVGGGRQVVIRNQVSAADLPSAPNCKQEPEEQSDHQEDDAAASSVNTTDQTGTSVPTNNDPSDNDPYDSDKYEELSSGDLENELYEQSDFEETEVAPSLSESYKEQSGSDEQPNASNAEDNAVQQEVSKKRSINLKRAAVTLSNTESESDNESDTPPTKKPKTTIAAKPTSAKNSAASTSSSAQPKRACSSKGASSSTEVHSPSSKSDATGGLSGSETDAPPTKKPKMEAIATKPISKANSAASTSSTSTTTIQATARPANSARLSKPSTSLDARSSSSSPGRFKKIRISYNDDNRRHQKQHDDSDDRNFNYDRWSSSHFPRISIVEIQCHIRHCKAMLRSKREHERHLRFDHKSQSFDCLAEACGKAYSNKTDWISHTLRSHSQSGSLSIECRYCIRTFSSLSTAFKHYLHHHEQGTFACVDCNFTSHLRVEVSEHIQSQHPANENNNKIVSTQQTQPTEPPQLNRFEFSRLKVNIIGCLHCIKTFHSEDKLAYHMVHVHRFRDFPCYAEQCKMSFHSPNELYDHNLIDHQSSVCPFCSEPLASMYKRDLKLHVLFHHQQGQFQCISCHRKATFASRADFRRHFSLVHKCPLSQCAQNAASSYLKSTESLIQHFETVHSISEFMCFHLNCHRHFSSDEHLIEHVINVHRTKESWACPRCTAGRFTTHQKLRVHINMDHFNGAFPSALPFKKHSTHTYKSPSH